MGGASDDFSVLVLASDLGVDARPFLNHQEQEEEESWHDCSQYPSTDEDFSDLELLQFLTLHGSDKNGNRILRIVGKYYPGNPSFLSITGLYRIQIGIIELLNYFDQQFKIRFCKWIDDLRCFINLMVFMWFFVF